MSCHSVLPFANRIWPNSIFTHKVKKFLLMIKTTPIAISKYNFQKIIQSNQSIAGAVCCVGVLPSARAQACAQHGALVVSLWRVRDAATKAISTPTRTRNKHTPVPQPTKSDPKELLSAQALLVVLMAVLLLLCCFLFDP